MKTAAIAGTGLEVTALSFGTSGLGSMPATYGYAVGEDRAAATLQAIIDSPVNMVDSSRIYGMGRSEERIGAVFAAGGGKPEGLVMATKLDRDFETDRFDAARARVSLEESLEKLGLDRIDILHLHDPEHVADLDEVTARGGALDELVRMREEGIVGAIGLAMGRLDLMEDLLFRWPFDCMISHNRYTLLNRSADALFTRAHDAGIAIINAAPYASGVLAKGSDRMKRITYQEADEAALEPVRRIEAVCAEFGIETGAAALQFSMRDPRIASTLVGVSRPESVARNLAWAEAEIPDEAWQALAKLGYSETDPEADRDYRAE